MATHEVILHCPALGGPVVIHIQLPPGMTRQQSEVVAQEQIEEYLLDQIGYHYRMYPPYDPTGQDH